MSEWSFCVWLSDVPDDMEAWSNALFEAGCDDSTVGVTSGEPFAIFDRKSDSLINAIRSAVADVQKAGLTVKRVEIEPAEIESW